MLHFLVFLGFSLFFWGRAAEGPETGGAHVNRDYQGDLPQVHIGQWLVYISSRCSKILLHGPVGAAATDADDAAVADVTDGALMPCIPFSNQARQVH